MTIPYVIVAATHRARHPAKVGLTNPQDFGNFSWAVAQYGSVRTGVMPPFPQGATYAVLAGFIPYTAGYLVFQETYKLAGYSDGPVVISEYNSLGMDPMEFTTIFNAMRKLWDQFVNFSEWRIASDGTRAKPYNASYSLNLVRKAFDLCWSDLKERGCIFLFVDRACACPFHQTELCITNPQRSWARRPASNLYSLVKVFVAKESDKSSACA